MPQSKLRGCATKVSPKRRSRNAKYNPDRDKSLSSRRSRSGQKCRPADKFRRFDRIDFVRSASKRSAKDRTQTVPTIAFVHPREHLRRDKWNMRNRVVRARRILRRPIEQQRPSENGSRDGRNHMPPGLPGPYDSHQRDQDIRHHKEEGALRQPPEKSQRHARRPVETIDPPRLPACCSCLTIGSDCEIDQGQGSVPVIPDHLKL